MIGSNLELYTRLLTEMHVKHHQRSTFRTRLALQDALCFIREQAAKDQGLTEELVQNSCEKRAEEINSTTKAGWKGD